MLGDKDVLDEATGPERIVAMLQQLGPTYVKIGQMMASRSDILPAELDRPSCRSSRARPRRSPTRTSSRSSPRSSARRRRTLYATFDPIPFAAASTAQVHQARLHDGTLVAVKVQRPRILAKTQADLGVIQELAGVAERRFAVARKVGLTGIVAEFAQGVLKELDYRNEAYHARRLADGMQRFPEIHVPTVYDELSGQRVITMEFVNGIKISKADELRAAGFDTTALGTVFIRAIIKQVLVDGFFHGDPHPGNILGRPDVEADHLPRPRPGRAAQRPAAGRPARPDLLDQGGRHPGHRRRAARARQADPAVRRGSASATTSIGSPAST